MLDLTFTHHCTACGRDQLTFLSQATSVAPATEGVALTFTCWCGAEQSTHVDLLTGRVVLAA